jgi:hypothetical protein
MTADRGRNTYRMVVHVDNDGGFRIRPARRFRGFGYIYITTVPREAWLRLPLPCSMRLSGRAGA